ncbi:type IV pilus assembly protein PilW [Oxalobacteraceae bacterium GrIS 1.11]
MNLIFFPRRNGGFSLVELMVSVVIALLALMFATRLVATSEKTKQASLGSSDAMQNGMVGLFSISGDAGQAGWGLNDPLLAGCNTVFSDTSGFVLATASRVAAGAATVVSPLAAAVIVSNGSNPDTLSLYSGSSMSGPGSLEVAADYATSAALLSVNRRPYGFALGDVVAVASEIAETPAAPNVCALSQIGIDPALQGAAVVPQTLGFTPAAGQRFNAAALAAPFLSGKARLFNMGPAASLSLHTWSINNGLLQLRATDLSGSEAVAKTVIDNVVSLKAQYGFDMRPAAIFAAPPAGPQITRWSGTMVDADGDGVTGNAGDYQRVVALRIAVVARSKNPDKPNVATNSCTATLVKPTVFAKVEPVAVPIVPAVPIDVNVAVPGDTVDWKCYTYRVFETIVPLRNAGWRPNA